MSLLYFAGDQTKAARIARELVKDLAPTDMETAITEHLKRPSEERLCAAIHDDYLKNETQIVMLEEKLGKLMPRKLVPLFDKYSELTQRVCSTKQTASFNLGFAAALRLLAIDARTSGKKRRA